MNGFDWNLDEMVGKIMADLRKNSQAAPDRNLSETLSKDFANVKADKQSSSQKIAEEPSSEVLNVTERVIVVETVARLAASSNLKTWQVCANAVVTPAARDELAKLGVRLIRGAASNIAAATKRVSGTPETVSRVTLSASNVAFGNANDLSSSDVGVAKKGVQVLLATHFQSSEQAPRVVVDYLKRNAEFSEFRLDCLKTTAERVADELAVNEKLKVVVVTHDGAIGSVWMNRKKGVRAVVAFSVEQSKRDIKAANANTLILDPRDLGSYQARQVVDFFVNQ